VKTTTQIQSLELHHLTEKFTMCLVSLCPVACISLDCDTENFWSISSYNSQNVNYDCRIGTDSKKQRTELSWFPISRYGTKYSSRQETSYLPPLVIQTVVIQQMVDSGWNLPFKRKNPRQLLISKMPLKLDCGFPKKTNRLCSLLLHDPIHVGANLFDIFS
jgi:hypothetical protein